MSLCLENIIRGWKKPMERGVVLRKFSSGWGEPKKSEPTYRKFSKRLRGTNLYRRLYLENSQETKRTDSCWCLYLENFLRDGREPKKGGAIALKRPSQSFLGELLYFFLEGRGMWPPWWWYGAWKPITGERDQTWEWEIQDHS